MAIRRNTTIFIVLVITPLKLSMCSPNNQENESNSTEDSDSQEKSSLITPCDFSIVRYSKEGGGLDFIIAEDPIQPECRFAFHFAERMSGETVAQIAKQGDTVKIYDIPGFMVATVSFVCLANSSKLCTADTGEVRIVVFDITADDLVSENISGKKIRFEIDAVGTKPGNQASFHGTIENTIP